MKLLKRLLAAIGILVLVIGACTPCGCSARGGAFTDLRPHFAGQLRGAASGGQRRGHPGGPRAGHRLPVAHGSPEHRPGQGCAGHGGAHRSQHPAIRRGHGLVDQAGGIPAPWHEPVRRARRPAAAVRDQPRPETRRGPAKPWKSSPKARPASTCTWKPSTDRSCTRPTIWSPSARASFTSPTTSRSAASWQRGCSRPASALRRLRISMGRPGATCWRTLPPAAVSTAQRTTARCMSLRPPASACVSWIAPMRAQSSSACACPWTPRPTTSMWLPTAASGSPAMPIRWR